MKTENSDAQPQTDAGYTHGRGAGIALGVAGLILVALLVLPGFIASGFSRMNGEPLSLNGGVAWDGMPSFQSMPIQYRVEWLVLAPSGFVMKHSPAMRLFYNWEYRTAGGKDVAFSL